MVYIFTSYFCTTLKNKGVEDLSGWTANNEIDLFSKRYAVISIFQVLHWSLCLISNSNFIEWDWSKCYCSLISCILIFVPVKGFYTKQEISTNIIEQRNVEWRVEEEPFHYWKYF